MVFSACAIRNGPLYGNDYYVSVYEGNMKYADLIMISVVVGFIGGLIIIAL